MNIKDAGKLYLDGKLRFYDLETMRKVEWYYALDNPDQCVVKVNKDWYRYSISHGFFGTKLRLTSY